MTPKVVCGLLTMELRLAENHSLKGKRQVVKSLKERLRSRFNISVAELEPLDSWQKAILAVTTVSKDGKMVESVLNKALNLVEEAHLAEVVDSQVEIY
jgi:uncharacterized protein YlxP (DUF503 family)